MKTFVKGPNERLDYSIDYTKELEELVDTIATSFWIVPSATVDGPSNLEIVLDEDVIPNYVTQTPKYDDGATSFDNYTTTVFLSGGTLDETYIIENHITTDDDRKYVRRFSVQIKNKES